jgi:hypothetical protein
MVQMIFTSTVRPDDGCTAEDFPPLATILCTRIDLAADSTHHRSEDTMQTTEQTTRRGVLRLIGSAATVATVGTFGAFGISEPAAARRRKRGKRKKNQGGQTTVCPAGQVVAQLQVSANGTIIETPVLIQGQKYRVQAAGSAALSSQFGFDAEYIFANADPSQGTNADSGIDAGLSIDDPTADNDKSPKWGAYNPNHVYETTYIGKGKPAQLRLHDGDYTDNSGSILVTFSCA